MAAFRTNDGFRADSGCHSTLWRAKYFFKLTNLSLWCRVLEGHTHQGSKLDVRLYLLSFVNSDPQPSWDKIFRQMVLHSKSAWSGCSALIVPIGDAVCTEGEASIKCEMQVWSFKPPFPLPLLEIEDQERCNGRYMELELRAIVGTEKHFECAINMGTYTTRYYEWPVHEEAS